MDASVSNGNGEQQQQQQQRKSNLQRIQQRKAAVRQWPMDKKVEKLAIYSSCKDNSASAECKCSGWKNPNPPPNPPRPDAAATTASMEDLCRTCNHSLRSHVSHLDALPNEEIDRLLGIVVDVEESYQLYFCGKGFG